MQTFKNPLQTMQIEIWSDVQCPFCYIGKTQLDQAIQQLGLENEVEIKWKSFQLDPTLPEKGPEGQKVYAYLAERKGWSLAQSKAMHEQVAERAAEVGLHFDFEKAIIANSFSAHRIMQKANAHGLGHRAEEIFFKAYFTDGAHLGDHETLVKLGQSIGLTAAQVEEALNQEEYAQKVEADIQEARALGVNGVPFFVLNRQYAVSGAQGTATFKEVLTKVKASMPALSQNEGGSCSVDGQCDPA
jgi:predicted DsbA family dithiol-disulfide isomerase